MRSTEAVTPAPVYDEFGLFHENAQEFGIAFDAPPLVRRVAVEVSDGYALSALTWGSEPPEVVLLHGGAQNAHTWDTVAMALDRPLVAIDLPNHGHSDGGHDGAFRQGVGDLHCRAVVLDLGGQLPRSIERRPRSVRSPWGAVPLPRSTRQARRSLRARRP